MAVGLLPPDNIQSVQGVQLATVSAGINQGQRPDLVLVTFEPGTSCAGVFTRNSFCAAPVTLARSHLAQTLPRALLINSGNANAGTGHQGLQDAKQCCALVAAAINCAETEVLPFSTGVIGQDLPMDRMKSGIEELPGRLAADTWVPAARAIMTTDTVPKACSRSLQIDGTSVTVTGIAKGSGMICPDMATMLAFIATDAVVDDLWLQHCLQAAVEVSFNAITVDGDTSTNDACVLAATGASGTHVLDGRCNDSVALKNLITEVCVELAQAIIRDGEGATKFVTIEVASAANINEARQLAYTVAHSPLVKTALFASDPNWGRILAAVGRAGLDNLDINNLRIFLDDVCIVSNGGRDQHYQESMGQAVMSRDEITLRITLGRGDAQARIWTTDLSYDYVKINAEYRT
jgi:glutamate N-acetyltransferase/amino-acid N-acetyltransferase